MGPGVHYILHTRAHILSGCRHLCLALYANIYWNSTLHRGATLWARTRRCPRTPRIAPQVMGPTQARETEEEEGEEEEEEMEEEEEEEEEEEQEGEAVEVRRRRRRRSWRIWRAPPPRWRFAAPRGGGTPPQANSRKRRLNRRGRRGAGRKRSLFHPRCSARWGIRRRRWRSGFGRPARTSLAWNARERCGGTPSPPRSAPRRTPTSARPAR
jgi:hypothetical protein